VPYRAAIILQRRCRAMLWARQQARLARAATKIERAFRAHRSHGGGLLGAVRVSKQAQRAMMSFAPLEASPEARRRSSVATDSFAFAATTMQ